MLIESHSAEIKKLQAEYLSINAELRSLSEEQKEASNKEEIQTEINELLKRRRDVSVQTFRHLDERKELQQQADPFRPGTVDKSIEEKTRASILASKPKKEKAKEEPEESSVESSASPIPPLPPPIPPSIEGRTTAPLPDPHKTTSRPHFDVKGFDNRGKEKQAIIRDAKDEEEAKRIAASRHDIQFVTSLKRNKVSEAIEARKNRGKTSTPTAPPSSPPSPSGPTAPPSSSDPTPTPFAGTSLLPPPPGGPAPSSGPIQQVHDAQMFSLMEKIQEKIATGGGSTPSAPTPAPGSPGGPPLPLFTPEEERTYARKKRGKLWRLNKDLGGTREDKKVGGTLEERRARRLEALHNKKFGTKVGKAAKRLGKVSSAVRKGAGGIGDAVGGIGEVAGAVGVAAEIAVPVAAFAAAVVEFGMAAYAFARSQEKEIRRQAEFGPQQAVGIAQLDAHRMQRDIKTAQETGGTSQELTQALDRLEETIRPIESLLQNIGNEVGAKLINTIDLAIKTIFPLVSIMNAILKRLPWGAEDETNWDLVLGAAKRAETLDPSWRRRTP